VRIASGVSMPVTTDISLALSCGVTSGRRH
jgi:hypothetical protein